MAYNKLFRYSSCHVTGKYFRQNLQSGSGKCCRILYKIKVPICGSFSMHKYQYSTFLHSRHIQSLSKSLHPRKSSINIAFMSTGLEKYEVIVTNPSQTPSASANVSVGHSASAAVEKVEVIKNDNSYPDSSETSSFSEDMLSEVVEPSLASIGLAHWTPVGLVQMFLEYLHIGHHMPWWLAITASTVLARIILIPLLIKTQRNAINMSNYMPQVQYLQAKFGEARRSGNSIEATRYASELMSFMKEHNISPLKNAMFPLLQAPVFLSFFLGLRAMAKAPVESMKYGGLWWTTDLTIPDPYYILPAVACSTLYVVLKIGAESGVKLENLKMARYVMQALPVIALPFCINFPSAVLYYWCTNNFCTLAIVSVLKIKPIREYCNLPSPCPIDPKYILPKKGFVAGVKGAYEDQKVLAAVEDRRRMDEIRFQRAGTGPIPRTYAYDPTKPRPSSVASAVRQNVSAKERKI